MNEQQTQTEPVQTTPPANDWRPFLSDDLKADPVVSQWAEKASEKDIPALIKGYAHTFKRMGSAVNLPGKDAKPEEVTAFKSKLYDAGLFTAPPADPTAYDFSKHKGALPDGFAWSDELSGKFATALHKHGVPPAALDDLMPLYLDALTGASKTLQTNYDAGMAALKQEHGEKFDERQEAVRRMSGAIFKTPEELAFMETTGLANHPAFLSIMMRLAPLALQDSSFMETVPHRGGEMTGEAAREEYAKVLSDPKHPHYEGLRRRDPKAEAYVNDLYRKAYGNAQVVL